MCPSNVNDSEIIIILEFQGGVEHEENYVLEELYLVKKKWLIF